MDGGSRLGLATTVALRTFVICTFGGMAVGLVGGPVLAALQGAPGEVVWAYSLFGAPFGMMLGMVLGVVGAFVLGAFAALALVPYRGAATTKRIMGFAAAVFVASGWCVLFWAIGELPAAPVLWSMIAPSVAGAALLGPITASGFIRRNESPIVADSDRP
jgi:hypothetical protein